MELAQQNAPVHLKHLQQVLDFPCIPGPEIRMLRAKLIMEEALETVLALGVDASVRYTGVGAGGQVPLSSSSLRLELNPTRPPDLIEIADGCADISVVTIGTLAACGISDGPLLQEVDRSNLDKFRGDAHMDKNGKWVKPSDWQKPDIAGVLERQRNTTDAT